MGHQSHNLLTAEGLNRYAGIVASPVNYDESELTTHVKTAQFRRQYDVVFDPQLYVPSTDRGQLRTWTYFPADVDTADLGSDAWWDTVLREVVAAVTRMKVDAVCSPAVLPRVFSDDYFDRTLANGGALARLLRGSGIRPLQTLVVNLAELADYGRAMTIASAVSKSECEEVYLVLTADKQPRREYDEPEELKGALRLIAALRDAGLRVFVAFASSDVVLWKAAGATHCGTGKFFNLRRFTSSRFAEPADGGKQFPYWFEESLLAFLRESDLLRVRKLGLLTTSNPFAERILAGIPEQKAWIALAWRQYLYWFADVQARIDRAAVDVTALLQQAETNWRQLDEAKPPVFMDERANDGAWLRQWRRALAEYPYPS
jgi:hypothetical protein